MEEETYKPTLVKGKKIRRILSELADIMLCLMLSLILFSATAGPSLDALPISKQMSSLSIQLKDEVKRSYIEEYDEDGNQLSSSDKKEYYFASILKDDGSEDPKDFIYSFYCLYESEGKEIYDVSRYNNEILHISEEDTLFEPGSRGEDYPYIFKMELRERLKEYLRGKTKVAENAEVYAKTNSFYNETFKQMRRIFIQTEPYKSNLLKYVNLVYQRAYIISAFAIASYMLSSITMFLIIPLIKMKGTTIGKKVAKLEARGKDGEQIRASQILIRAAIQIISFIFIIPLSPFFLFGLDSFTIPFMMIGGKNITMSLFFVIGFVITLVSLAFLLISKEGFSLHGLASSTDVFTTDQALISAEEEKRKNRGNDGF